MKVNISNSVNKKNPLSISLDSSTTANFGECLPIFSHELPPNTHMALNIRDAVRFAPLSFPTFGKAYLNTYAFCHKIHELYPPFNDLLGRTPYTSSSGSMYVPTEVPSVPLYLLWLSVLSCCEFTYYSTDFKGVHSYNQGNNPFYVTSIPYVLIDTIKHNNFVMSDEEISASLPLWLTEALYKGNPNLPGQEGLKDAAKFFSYLTSNDYYDKLVYNNDGSNLSSVYSNNPNENDDVLVTRKPVTPSSADYIFYLPASISGFIKKDNNGKFVYSSVPGNSFLFTNIEGNNKSHIMVCIRLNNSGKFLRKIFMGLGYQIAPLNRPVSILPLYAYFKSYFETFAPKRFVKFEQTYFARIINSVVNTGNSLVGTILGKSINDSSVCWSNIIDDLLSCYYTKDTDYYSSQIIGLINDYGNDITQKYLGVYTDPDNNVLTIDNDTLSSDVKRGVVPSIKFDKENVNQDIPMNHTQNQQNILSRLTQFVNRRSVIGSKLSALLKSVFGISQKDVDDYNFRIGSNSIDVNFSDVFSTAETSEGSLGEYAGKAMAFGNGDTYHVDTTTHSIVLAFSVIVPRTQYVQGVSPLLSHIKADDFYNPMFDGLTLLPTRKSNLYCGNGFLAFDDNELSFGNSPIYSEYKTKTCGVLTGDLSLNSTKASYDSFTMDELIGDFTYIKESGTDYDGLYNNISYNPNGLVAGTMWRYLGRWLWLGRFDRIFVNNRVNWSDFIGSILPTSDDGDIQSTRDIYRSDDNLVVHHVVDMKLNSAVVPLRGTWMTDDLLSLDSNGVTVQSE